MNETPVIKFGLTTTQYSLIENAIISFKDIEKVLIFGSRATHNFRPASDIDLAVIGKNIDRNIINRLSAQLDDLPLPFTFDVLNYDQIENRKLKTKIDSAGALFFEKNK